MAGIARHYGVGADAEDLVQEVFLRAWRYLPGLRRHDRFGPWLAQMTRNEGLMYLRRKRVRDEGEPETAQISAAHPPPTPAEEVEERQVSLLLDETLGRIAPEYRIVLCLHYVEGCTYRQIVRCLSLPLATVSWRMLEGMRRLQRLVPRELATVPATAPSPDRRRRVLGALATPRLRP